MVDPLQVMSYLDLRAETQARDRGLKEKVMSLEKAAELNDRVDKQILIDAHSNISRIR